MLAALSPGVAEAQSAQDGQAPISLRPQWEAGQSSRYAFWSRIEDSSRLEMGRRTRNMTVIQEIEGEISWEVQRVASDGSTVNTMTIDWTEISVTRNGETMTADSRRGPPGAPGQGPAQAVHDMISAMTGSPLTVELNPDGSVERLTGLQAMQAKTDNAELLPELLDFKETVSSLAALAFAPQSIAPGGSFPAQFLWNHELGKIQQDWTYTLESIDRVHGVPLATVTGQADIELIVEMPDRPQGAPPVDIEMTDGQVASEVLFDLSRHEVMARNSRKTIRIVARVQLPEGNQLIRTRHRALSGQLLRIAEQ